MPLIREGRIVADSWRRVSDEEPLPRDVDPIVGLTRWKDERESLIALNRRLGLFLEAGESPDEVVGDLERLSLIALEFPKFNDGRAFSYARLLRERHGFTGELRAVGQVLRDQLFFMLRCGFDAFEVGDEVSPEVWRKALREINHVFQATGDGRATAIRLRAGRDRVAAE